MKRAVQTAMEAGAEGIRIRCAGRLGGADIARAEWYRLGKVPLQTLRIPIDYGFAEARTVYGIIGVKVWLNASAAIEGGATRPQSERRRERSPRDRNSGGRGSDTRGGDRGGVSAQPKEIAAEAAPAN
jgi:small subunit ribosomal protein S3